MSVYDVVVIGAGAAGLGASYILRTRPLKYLVLEASDRTGGRAHTITHKNTALDMGAGWFHHGRKNVMLPLAQSQNKRVSPVGLERFPTQPQSFEFETACASIDVEMEKAAVSENDIPAADTFDINNPPTAAAAYWMCNIDMGTDPQKTSVLSWMQFAGDGENNFCHQGYGTVVEDGFRHVPVTLNTPVQQIDYSSDLIHLHTPQGIITTKKCICTVSMGVLNASHIQFTPELPPWKQRAFNDVQMGHLLKVHMELNEAQTIPEDTWIYEPHDEKNFFFYHLKPAGTPWVVVYLGGSHASELGKRTPDEVTEILQKPLIQRYQLNANSSLGDSFFTDWGSHPHTLGAYASHCPGEFPLNQNLHRPVEQKIFFAGEAFAGAYGQTVDGAFNSGQHTADEVVRLLLG